MGRESEHEQVIALLVLFIWKKKCESCHPNADVFKRFWSTSKARWCSLNEINLIKQYSRWKMSNKMYPSILILLKVLMFRRISVKPNSLFPTLTPYILFTLTHADNIVNSLQRNTYCHLHVILEH